MILPALGTIEGIRLLAQGVLGWADCALFVGMYIVHMGGVTIGLHRLVAHRSFSTSDWFRDFLVICGSTAGQGPVLYWVATHRAHHAHSDTEFDPHTPQRYGPGLWANLRGLWYAHMPWMLSTEIANPTHYARDVLRDRGLVRLSQSYPVWLLLGLVVPAAIGVAIHGGPAGLWYGLIVGGLARMGLANHAAWCVGSVCHMFGSRPFKTNDQSGNNWWVAIVAFGEGLQNNHHAFPSHYRHAIRWYEPDFSGWLIYALLKCGLVWDLRAPSPGAIRRMRKS
jgi:stearoyl-CoA desaturase (delta-9 desaturase)